MLPDVLYVTPFQDIFSLGEDSLVFFCRGWCRKLFQAMISPEMITIAHKSHGRLNFLPLPIPVTFVGSPPPIGGKGAYPNAREDTDWSVTYLPLTRCTSHCASLFSLIWNTSDRKVQSFLCKAHNLPNIFFSSSTTFLGKNKTWTISKF